MIPATPSPLTEALALLEEADKYLPEGHPNIETYMNWRGRVQELKKRGLER